MVDAVKVILIVKPSKASFAREGRSKGYFSYEVPEFKWELDSLGNAFRAPLSVWREYDVLIQEDGGNWGTYVGKMPKVFIAFDSTLSDRHYEWRLRHSKQFDMVLIDHDRLERFPGSKRFSYCVNDRVFFDRGLDRDIDVSFHCASSGPGDGTRTKVRKLLGKWSETSGITYTSGVRGLDEYAENMARSKIIVNWPRVSINRPFRVFDAMASGACLITGTLPEVSGEEKVSGRDFIEVADHRDLPKVCEELLESGRWKEIAANGYKLVREKHTWAVRAKELRELLKGGLGI